MKKSHFLFLFLRGNKNTMPKLVSGFTRTLTFIMRQRRATKLPYKSKCSGFTLLEVLLVTSIVVLLSTIGVGYFLDYGKSVEINSVTETLKFDLKQAQSKSMIGEGGFKWGVHFVNGVSNDYYEIFSTPTDYNDNAKVVISTNYLSNGVTFSSPTVNSFTNVIFNKISGGASDSSIVMNLGGVTKTINVSSIGNISVQ